jgi:pseudouridine-5'-phosphate glycosidase
MFYSGAGGPPVSATVGHAAEAATVAATHWQLVPSGGLLLARPPESSLEGVESLIEAALADAQTAGVRGQAITPFVLDRLHAASGGATLRANRELVLGNAALAGAVALAASAA